MHLKRLEAVFMENRRRLFVAALSITRNRELAEDAVHDALIAVAGTRTSIDDIRAYLFRVVRNKALYLNGARARDTNFEEDYLDTVNCPGEDNHFVLQVKRHISALDVNEQQALMLKLFEDLTFSEIAEVMDSPPNTVASWYRRGLEKLKEKLDAKP